LKKINGPDVREEVDDINGPDVRELENNVLKTPLDKSVQGQLLAKTNAMEER